MSLRRSLAGLVVLSVLGGTPLLAGCSSDDATTSEVARFRAEEQARKDALAAANAFVQEVTTYSYKEGEHDFSWVEELQDEALREQYRDQAALIEEAVVKGRTTARGEVLRSAATVVDETQVEVLVALEQTITDAEGQSSVEQPTISLTMTDRDGTWRVTSLEFLNVIGLDADADPTGAPAESAGEGPSGP